MYAIIGLAGFFGFFVYLIRLIICALKKKSKKNDGIGMLVCVLLFSIGVATSPTDEDSNASRAMPDEPDVSVTATDKRPESSASTPDAGPVKSGTYTLSNGIRLDFENAIKNDKTGNWRISSTAGSTDPANYALEYYQKMFSSDEEIHAIHNTARNTTTRITTSSGLLFVDTLEYVKGEEHDANLLFSGTLLDSKIIDAETGEIFEEEKNQPDAEPVKNPDPAEILETKPTPNKEVDAKQPAPSPGKTPSSNTGSSSSGDASSSFKDTTGTSGTSQLNSNESGAHDFSNGEVLVTLASNNNDDPVYHTKYCRAAKKIAPEDMYWYASAKAAEADGRRLCGYCD